MNKTEREQGLQVDVDTRLTPIWTVAWDNTLIGQRMDEDAELAKSVGLLLRAAYGLGYCDALREDSQGRRAELHRANGYRVPPPGRFTT